MLYFSENNIFTWNTKLSDRLIFPILDIEKLIPFQFSYDVVGYLPTKLELIGNKTIDLVADLSKFQTYNKVAQPQRYYIFNSANATLATSINCGVYQFKVRLTNYVGAIKYFYSNFFRVENTQNYAVIKYSNSKDFNNKVYQYGFENIMYLDRHIIDDEPFNFEIATENGDGSRVIEYQSFAQKYKVAFYANKYSLKELILLPEFDTVKVTFDDFTDYQITDRIDYSFSYNSDYKLYNFEFNFRISEIKKTLCESNYNLTLYNGNYNKINVGGDQLKINNTDLQLIT